MRLGAAPVADHGVYLSSMRLPLLDKLFFLDKVELGSIIDVGCADGTMLAAIEHVEPGLQLIGVDICPEMRARANITVPRAEIVADLAAALAAATARPRLVVLSSVIHEVYSYLGAERRAAFFEAIWNSGAEWIAIRDMMPGRDVDRPANPVSVARVRQMAHPERLAQFEEAWGAIDGNRALLHYLLKYRYAANWAREVTENYLPTTAEAFLAGVPRHYEVAYMDHFTLPYLRENVRRDFGVDLQDRSHLKLILRLRSC
ncbi:methyltransferase domain-containing protein [Inquilinus sp. OTU3971]|uniref:methyltransferase domain-containing protein n=1 Tax=Inquilinus sp. OTU3971 TaxID=3043855 RepID=UPI00313B2CBA